MIKISLRYKIALELYASLSFLAAIIIFVYSTINDWFEDNIYIPAGMIGLFVIAFIFSIKTLILDVNSATFENENSKYDLNIVEITMFKKVALELFSAISNIIIFTIIFIFGIEKSSGANAEIISISFKIILLLPLIILFKSLIFNFNLIFREKKHRENFLDKVINRRTIFVVVIAIIVISTIFASNKLNNSVANLYSKSMSTGEETLNDISANIYITSITGDRNNISGAPITGLSMYVEANDFDFNISHITIKYITTASTSTLNYGMIADESHFYYEGKTAGKGDTRLRKDDIGIITINLTATKQELYSHNSGTIQLILGNGKNISKNFKAPELKEDPIIQLYPRF